MNGIIYQKKYKNRGKRGAVHHCWRGFGGIHEMQDVTEDTQTRKKKPGVRKTWSPLLQPRGNRLKKAKGKGN